MKGNISKYGNEALTVLSVIVSYTREKWHNVASRQ